LRATATLIASNTVSLLQTATQLTQLDWARFIYC